jgi:hypothetical protein
MCITMESVVRLNCFMEYEKFYDKVLKDRNLLRKRTSSEKYSWYDRGEIQRPHSSLHKFLYGCCH